MRSHEVTAEQNLLNESGEIHEAGWARRQVWNYHRKDIKAPGFRIKEWDYYMVVHDGGDNDSYAVGLQSVSLLCLNKENPWEHTETVLNVFPMGKFHLPENSSEGDTVYEDKRLKMKFHIGEKTREISCEFASFWNEKPLSAHIVLEQPDMDTMVIATPWDEKHCFYYNQKWINGTMRC